jgi:hypothetical protein
MSNGSDLTAQSSSPVPPDDDRNLLHIGLVGDTYTILLSGKETAGCICLIYMHVPPGDGPPPHRHDFEETFIVVESQVDATFRGKKRAGARGVKPSTCQQTRLTNSTIHLLVL